VRGIVHLVTAAVEGLAPERVTVVDSAGRVLVLDSLPGWIKRYTPDGELVDQFAGPDARFYHPRSLSIDAADNLYVADTGGGRVVKFNGKGEQVAVIGQRGTGQGQIMEPTGASGDAFGNVWVADSANAKLVRYDPNGSADVELSLPKSGSLHGPHVAVAEGGDVYVTDPEGGRVYVIGSDGTTRGAIESEELRRPVGITIAPDGRLVVGDVTLQHAIVLAPPEGGR
jgi:sugar lactone lactonase YvrE